MCISKCNEVLSKKCCGKYSSRCDLPAADVDMILLSSFIVLTEFIRAMNASFGNANDT